MNRSRGLLSGRVLFLQFLLPVPVSAGKLGSPSQLSGQCLESANRQIALGGTGVVSPAGVLLVNHEPGHRHDAESVHRPRILFFNIQLKIVILPSVLSVAATRLSCSELWRRVLLGTDLRVLAAAGLDGAVGGA